MPQPRKYAGSALKQAAYRRRQAAARDDQLRAKGLPPLPALPQIPGRARWRAAIESACELLEQTTTEMEGYHADRSDEWRETARADALQEQIDTIERALDELHTLSD